MVWYVSTGFEGQKCVRRVFALELVLIDSVSHLAVNLDIWLPTSGMVHPSPLSLSMFSLVLHHRTPIRRATRARVRGIKLAKPLRPATRLLTIQALRVERMTIDPYWLETGHEQTASASKLGLSSHPSRFASFHNNHSERRCKQCIRQVATSQAYPCSLRATSFVSSVSYHRTNVWALRVIRPNRPRCCET